MSFSIKNNLKDSCFVKSKENLVMYSNLKNNVDSNYESWKNVDIYDRNILLNNVGGTYGPAGGTMGIGSDNFSTEMLIELENTHRPNYVGGGLNDVSGGNYMSNNGYVNSGLANVDTDNDIGVNNNLYLQQYKNMLAPNKCKVNIL